MFQKAFSYGGMLLLAGAAVLVTPSSGQAQRGGHGGGGHFGGGHFGGTHLGGGHFGGYHGGFYRGGWNHGGYGRAYGWRGYHHPYYGVYGYYPYSYGTGVYGSYPYSYDTYPYVGSDLGYDSGYYGSYGDVTTSDSDGYASVTPPAGSYQSFYPTAQPDARAHVTATVPADAQIWFEGVPTTSTGTVREFNSPPLTPGSQYTYEVRASWNENGHEVTQTQQVKVTAGAHVNVTFPVRP
jgi:uncharacterized protein (TIGR03000 family)